MKLFISLIVAMGCLPWGATAQKQESKPPEMHIDLPDETEETNTLKKGQWQVEASGLYNWYQSAPSSEIGQILLRHGIANNLEVRILAEDGRNRDQYIEETVQSTYPLAAGIKIAALQGHSWLPDVSFVTYLKLPFTSRTQEQTAYWSPIFIAAFQNRAGEKWTIGYNLGIQQNAYQADWFFLANASVHYKISDPVEIFGEYYAQYTPGDNPQHNAGVGIAWQCADNIEFFLSAGSTVDYEEANRFVNGGIAYRMP